MRRCMHGRVRGPFDGNHAGKRELEHKVHVRTWIVCLHRGRDVVRENEGTSMAQLDVVDGDVDDELPAVWRVRDEPKVAADTSHLIAGEVHRGLKHLPAQGGKGECGCG